MKRRAALLAGLVLLGAIVPYGIAAPLLIVAASAFTVTAVIATRFGIDRLALVLMVLNAFLLPMNSFRLGPLMNVSDVLLLATASMIVLTQLLRPTEKIPAAYRKFLSSFTVIAFGGMLATAVAMESPSAFAGLGRFILSTLGVLWVIAKWAPDEASVRAVVWAFVVGASVSAAVGLNGADAFYGRSIGLANHPNHFGTISMFGAAAGMALGVSSSGAGRLVAWLLSALLAVGVLQSGSRAALFGLVVSVIALLLALRSIRFVLRAMVTVALLLVVAVSVTSRLPSANALDRLLDPSASGAAAANVERERLYEETARQISHQPIVGSGFQFALVAHSLYLQLWVSAGLLGVLGLARVTYWSARLLQLGRGTPLFAGMMAGFIGFLGNAVFTNILWDRYIWTFLALALALAPLRPGIQTSSNGREIVSNIRPERQAIT